MGHWLEDIENQEARKRRSARDSARVQDKIFRIKQNYDKNKDLYDRFIKKMEGLIERVNNLPMEHREEFGKLKFEAKRSKLSNHLYNFASSKRVQKMQFGGLLRPLKNVHYKHVRVIYVNVAKLMGKVEFEIKEELLEKKRQDGKVIPEETSKSRRRPEDKSDRFHEFYYYDMEELNDEFALKIIDWLTFHENLEALPIIRNGELRQRSRY
jgi:hypothetical protein